MRTLILFGCLWLCFAAAAQTPDFEPDDKLAENARKWATEMVTFASERYDEELDWSQNSIKYLDDIVDDLHKIYLNESPPDEMVVPLARALGSYVAEVYRIFYGGKWGWLNLEEGSFPAVHADNGANYLPLKKALDRIKTGDDPDIWEYFQLMTAQ